VAGDEVYGANPGLRAALEARQIGYVLAFACDHPVRFGGATRRADALLGDQHQVRRWRSWYRWTTLAMLANAFLVVAAVTEQTRQPPSSGLIPLTCNELQHLFAALVARPAGDRAHRLRWSVWRRRHQARAHTCHYRRQATTWQP
jgi:hypothetical protein